MLSTRVSVTHHCKYGLGTLFTQCARIDARCGACMRRKKKVHTSSVAAIPLDTCRMLWQAGTSLTLQSAWLEQASQGVFQHSLK